MVGSLARRVTEYCGLVLPQLALGDFVFWKLLDTMCSDCLVLREDPSTFQVVDVYKYSQNFINFI